MGVEFTLNGQLIPSPKDWSTARVNAIFMQNSQPDISVDTFTFESKAVQIIDSWIAQNGLFRGCPFVINLDGTLLDYHLDFDKFTKVHDGKYIVGIKKTKSLNSLSDKIEGYTMALLAERRSLTTYEIPYVVVKKYTGIEFIMLSITTYMLIKEILDTKKQVEDLIADIQGATAGAPFSYGDFLAVTIKSLLFLAYKVAVVVALKNLIEEIINKIYPITKKHKGFKIKDHLRDFVIDAGFNGIEFGFDMDNLYYFPSKEDDFKAVGIPNAQDYGYLMSEMVEFVKKFARADFAVDNKGVVQVRNQDDIYFARNSTYKMPSILQESIKYNNADLKGTKIISFRTDVTDEWTIDNYKGTSYEVHTRSKTENGESLIKGLEEVRLNVALANRKDKFTALEKAIKEMAQLADNAINILGGSSNMAGRIKKRLGFVKVSNETWSLPKVMKLNSDLTLATNHRDLWSAKYIQETFHMGSSFVFDNQKRIFEDVELPICSNDFESLMNNSYFTTDNGIGKFTKLNRTLDGEKAIGSYWIKEIYDRNLEETYIEP